MNNKRKFLVLILTVTMMFMVGCNSKNNNVNEEESNAVTETEGTESTSEESTTESDSGGVNPLEALGLDYTIGLDEDGFYENIKATDLVELVDYKNISVPVEVHTVEEQAVEIKIDELMANFIQTLDVMDRKVVNGDTVNIDYVGSVDGVDFEGGSTGGAGTVVTIGVTSYIDGFLDQLIGHMPGETFDINVTFPEDYNAEHLKGKDAVFAITINVINETVYPELTDEFVKENFLDSYQSSTVAELRTTVADDMKEIALKSFIQEYLIENVLVNSVPEEVMAYQTMSMENYYKTSALRYNQEVDEFIASNFSYNNLEEFVAAAEPRLQGTSELSLIIQAIAEENDIRVTEEELSSYFTKYLGVSDYSEIEGIYGLSYLKNSILQDTVLDALIEKVTLEN